MWIELQIVKCCRRPSDCLLCWRQKPHPHMTGCYHCVSVHVREHTSGHLSSHWLFILNRWIRVTTQKSKCNPLHEYINVSCHLFDCTDKVILIKILQSSINVSKKEQNISLLLRKLTVFAVIISLYRHKSSSELHTVACSSKAVIQMLSLGKLNSD